jgi:predicted Mrr-cat superfamily restriction endonuclease
MNIFQMKTKPHDRERLSEFIKDNFVCIGWPGIGNLEKADIDEIRRRIADKYNVSGHQLGNWLGQVNCFVNTMKKDDVVLITEKDSAHIGILGDYEYLSQLDNDQDGACHRRSVKWVNTVKIAVLDPKIQRLLSNRNAVSQFSEAFTASGLQVYLDKNYIIADSNSISLANSEKVNELFQEALRVLEEELKSSDPDRKLKAASELLRLKNNL